MTFFYKRPPSTGGVTWPLESPLNGDGVIGYGWALPNDLGFCGVENTQYQSIQIKFATGGMIEFDYDKTNNKDLIGLQNGGNFFGGQGDVSFPGFCDANTSSGMYFDTVDPNAVCFSHEGVHSLKINKTSVAIPEGNSLILNTAGTAYIRWAADFGNQIHLRVPPGITTLNTSGEFSVSANCNDDGSGSYEPFFILNSNGDAEVSNGVQGIETSRTFYITMDQGFSAGFRVLSSLRKTFGFPVVNIGYDANGASADNAAIRSVGALPLVLGQNNTAAIKLDNSVTADDTRLLLWDVTAGSLVRVTRGVADSGGVGYRVLRIPN
jgi:hypothetical protein